MPKYNKYKKKERKNTHHTIPLSRGGKRHPSNEIIINKNWHMHYHAIFGNMTPLEILLFLIDRVWKGKWYLLLHAYKKRRKAQEILG